MDGKRNGAFWPSYVDIMTTLFAIMLVLFAVSYSRFKVKEKQLQTVVDEYENIIALYSTVGKIDSTAYFGYNAEYLKHLFTVDVEYQEKEYAMNKLRLDATDSLAAQEKRDSVVAAGKLIEETLLALEGDTLLSNIKFLVIIEGQASRVGFHQGDWQNNYTLSYLRAQYLNEFWKQNGIDLDALPKCELIISGSGEGGVPRVVPDEDELRRRYPDKDELTAHWMAEERKNQRFLMHIVPVLGNIEMTKEKIEKLKGN